MNFLKLIIAIGISNTFFALSAGEFKEKPKCDVVDVNNKAGFYTRIGIGIMKLKDDYTLEYFQSNPFLFSLGYSFNDYLSVEARYSKNIGNVTYRHGNTINNDYDDFPTTFTNIGAYLVPKYSLNDKFSLYGLLGYGKVKLTNIKGADRYETSFQWGIGLTYKLYDHLDVFIDYTRLYGDKGFGGRAKKRFVHADSVFMGVKYAF